MVALVVVVTFVVLLLSVLVAGLLRSHADILRSLHELGVGVGDPAARPTHVPARAHPFTPDLVANQTATPLRRTPWPESHRPATPAPSR